MTFQACDSAGGTFVPVYAAGGGAVYSVTVGTSRYVPLDRDVFAGVRFVKLVSGSTELGLRVIRLLLRSKA
jgi:hypothetical protein